MRGESISGDILRKGSRIVSNADRRVQRAKSKSPYMAKGAVEQAGKTGHGGAD